MISALRPFQGPLRMHRLIAKTLLCVLFASATAFCRDVTIHGFVTAVNSPTSFEIDDYKVTHDKTVSIDLEKQADSSLDAFKPEDIRIGTELEIKGEYGDASGELKAKFIKVFSYDTLTVKRTALLEKLPSFVRDETGWSGVIYADGQRITVTPTTAVSLKPNLTERRNAAKDKGPDGSKLTPDSLNLRRA